MLTPRQTSPQATKQRNYKGLKLTTSMHTWGISWVEDTRGRKTHTATSEGPGAKRGHWEQTPPPEGWASHRKPASSLTPGHTPALTPQKE